MDIDVKHVANLAKLSLSEEELVKLEKELQSILDHVRRLLEVDVTGVPPTFGTGDDTGVALAEDVPRPGLIREIALFGAPEVSGVYFKVPREADQSGRKKGNHSV